MNIFPVSLSRMCLKLTFLNIFLDLWFVVDVLSVALATAQLPLFSSHRDFIVPSCPIDHLQDVLCEHNKLKRLYF